MLEMGPARVVEGEAAVDPRGGGGDGVADVEIDFLVFQGAPEPLDKGMVASGALAVHAELNALCLEYVGEAGAGEL